MVQEGSGGFNWLVVLVVGVVKHMVVGRFQLICGCGLVYMAWRALMVKINLRFCPN